MATVDKKRFLHPEAIKRIARLDLQARHIVEGFLAGMHRSPYFGQSVEFLQHREYSHGDDLRHVDWKVWAKQDRLLRQAIRGRNQSAGDAVGRCVAQHAIRPRADEQIRVRLHRGGEPGLSAVAATRRGRLPGVRRRGAGHRAACAPSAAI